MEEKTIKKVTQKYIQLQVVYNGFFSQNLL